MGAVRLTVVADEGAAEILCGALRAEGIPCWYRSTDQAAAYSEGWYSFGGMREILVDEGDIARAAEIAESVAAAVDECVRCGRAMGPDGGWYESAGGELEPYCAVCVERVLGPA